MTLGISEPPLADVQNDAKRPEQFRCGGLP